MNKRVMIFLGVLLAGLLLHFVPVVHKTGVLDYGRMNVCIGYSHPTQRHYRVVFGGWSEFQKDNAHFKPSSQVGCAEPVTLRLYVF